MVDSEEEQESQVTRKVNQTARQVIEYVEEYFAEYDLSLDFVAAKFSLNSAYLSRIIKQELDNAAVLFISGQSNAHAHAQRLQISEYIETPLKNVFSLDRNPNQSFDITDVVWSGFSTQGKNLGEIQDNTSSLSYFFAKLWQNAIDCGADLPDLYIVQISVGSQGIINGMWNRDKEKVMIPGPLGKVNISLFPWAMQINRLVMKNLKQNGKMPIVIGWHWIGSEQELHGEAYKRDDFQERYNYFFDSMLESIGEPCPLYLYKLGCKKYCERHGLVLH